MLVPLSWLREYVALPTDSAAIIERLTIAGLEAAGVKVFGAPVPAGIRVKPEDAGLVWEEDKVMVAKVLEITKHPEADKLKLVKLDYGGSEPKTVVTGATNIAPGQSGMKVILGLRGTKYFYTDKDGFHARAQGPPGHHERCHVHVQFRAGHFRRARRDHHPG